MAVYCWNCGYETPFGVAGDLLCPNCQAIKAQTETRKAVDRLRESLTAYPLEGVETSDIAFLAEDLAAVGYDLEDAIDYHISRVVDRLIKIQGITEKILTEEEKQTYYLGELLKAIQAPARTKVSEQIEIARHQTDAGFQTEALQRLNEAERDFPIDPRIYFLRATILHKQNRLDEALAEIEKGVKMIIPEHPGDTHSPEHDYALGARALLWATEVSYNAGLPQKAIQFFRRVYDFLPTYKASIEEQIRHIVCLAEAEGVNEAIDYINFILMYGRHHGLKSLLKYWTQLLLGVSDPLDIPQGLKKEGPPPFGEKEDNCDKIAAEIFSNFQQIHGNEKLRQYPEITKFLNECYVKLQNIVSLLKKLGLIFKAIAHLERLHTYWNFYKITPYRWFPVYSIKPEAVERIRIILAHLKSGKWQLLNLDSRIGKEEVLKILYFLLQYPGKTFTYEEINEATSLGYYGWIALWNLVSPGESGTAYQTNQSWTKIRQPQVDYFNKYIMNGSRIIADKEYHRKAEIAKFYGLKKCFFNLEWKAAWPSVLKAFSELGIKEYSGYDFDEVCARMVKEIGMISYYSAPWRDIAAVIEWWDYLLRRLTQISNDVEILLDETDHSIISDPSRLAALLSDKISFWDIPLGRKKWRICSKNWQVLKEILIEADKGF